MSKHYMYLHREIQAKTYFAYFEPMYFNFSLFWGTKVKIGFKLTSQQFTEILNVF